MCHQPSRASKSPLDSELAAAEVGGTEPRSRADKNKARGHLLRIAAGEDDGYDFAVSEQLHADR